MQEEEISFILEPSKIERKSLETVAREVGQLPLSQLEQAIVKRVIHATADFDFAATLRFSPGAAEIGLNAVRQGATLFVDTRMIEAGVSKPALQRLGCSIECHIDEPAIAREAEARGVTRSMLAVERACCGRQKIFVIGNAPTALLSLHQRILQGLVKPVLVIAVPVGFVNVSESKQLILKTDVPYIVAEGRKGGSTVAVAIINALLYAAGGGDRR